MLSIFNKKKCIKLPDLPETEEVKCMVNLFWCSNQFYLAFISLLKEFYYY